MSTLTTLLVTVAGLILTMLGLIAKQEDNIEIRKILAWAVFVIITLLLPSFIITWLTMQIIARILTSTVIDMSSFTSQVSWWTGSLSMIYPLVWGVSLYPKIEKYIQERLLTTSKKRGGKNTK